MSELVYRPTNANSIRSGIDPNLFPVATHEARQEAEELAEAFAADLNLNAGRDIAAAKASLTCWPMTGVPSFRIFQMSPCFMLLQATSLRMQHRTCSLCTLLGGEIFIYIPLDYCRS